MTERFLVFFLLILVGCLSLGASAVNIINATIPSKSSWVHTGCRPAYLNRTAAYMYANSVLLCPTPRYSKYTMKINTTGYYNWLASFQVVNILKEMEAGTKLRLIIAQNRVSVFFEVWYTGFVWNYRLGYDTTVLRTDQLTFGQSLASTVRFSKYTVGYNFASAPTIWYSYTLPSVARMSSPDTAIFGTSWTTISLTGGFVMAVYTFGLTGTPCPEDCAACTSSTVCTTCAATGWDPATLCQNCSSGYKKIILYSYGVKFCLPICANNHCTCTSPAGCTGCTSGFQNPGALCTECSTYGMYYDFTTGTCKMMFLPSNTTSCPMLDYENCTKTLGCHWCSLPAKCRSSAIACPSCTDFATEEDCNVTGVSEGCRWCDLESRCSDPDTNCLAACSQLDSQSACDAVPSCHWVESTLESTCMNDTEFLAFTAEDCSAYDELFCANSSTCNWCGLTDKCTKATDECSLCNAAANATECVPLNSTDGTSYDCYFCPTSKVCSASTCADCSWASADHCGSGDYIGCHYCQANRSCVPEEQSIADCSCGSRNNSVCDFASGCKWCDSLGVCVNSDTSCVPCDARPQSQCTAPYCSWNTAMQVCVDASQPSVHCSDFASVCETFPGCDQCTNGYCLDFGTCVTDSSGTGKSEAASHPSSGGGGGGFNLPMWAYIAIGAAGLALIVVIISVSICLAVASKRKKNRRGAQQLTEERSEIDLSARSGLTTGELSGMHEVAAADLLLEVSKATLTFGGKHAILKLDVPVVETFDVTNKGAQEAIITAHVPPKDEIEGRFDIYVEPQDLTLASAETHTMTVTLTPRCTTTLKVAVALWRRPARTFTVVNVEAVTEPSTRLDWNELQISQQLGKGGFGTVYKAMWRGMPVAVKEMASHLWEIKETRAEVLREVDLMNRLRSPFIVCFHGVVMAAAHKAIVMELAPMGSLHPLLAKQQLSNQVRVKIATNCAQGMQLLHANGILHRDLKPDNLLVFSLNPREEVLVKLTDFGTSRSVADAAAREYTKGVGTPVYMAPEILNGDQYGMAADVYSFGISLWEIVTQKTPYEEFENQFAIVAFISEGKRLKIPDSPLADLTARCWAHDPAARPTFPQIVSDLATLVS